MGPLARSSPRGSQHPEIGRSVDSGYERKFLGFRDAALLQVEGREQQPKAMRTTKSVASAPAASHRQNARRRGRVAATMRAAADTHTSAGTTVTSQNSQSTVLA